MGSTIAPTFDTASTGPIPDSARIRVYDLVCNIIGLFVFASFGVIFNVFILIVVGKNKNLQTSCFLLICGECVFSICLASSHLTVSVQEAVILAGLVNITRSRVLCYISMASLCITGIQGSSLITNCVAMDRLISILLPNMYRQMGNRYVKICWVFCFTYSIMSSMSNIIIPQTELNDTVQCTNIASSITHNYSIYHSTFCLIFSGLCVFLYAAIFIAFNWRKKTIADPTATEAFLKRQRACLPTVKLLMIFYGITAVFPEFCLFIVVSFGHISAYVPRLTLYTAIIKAASPSAQIVGLYFGSKRFRKCARSLLGFDKENTPVVPMTNAGNLARRNGPRIPRANAN